MTVERLVRGIVGVGEQVAHRAGKARHFSQVKLGEGFEPAGADCGEPEPNEAAIVGVGCPRDEALGFGAVLGADPLLLPLLSAASSRCSCICKLLTGVYHLSKTDAGYRAAGFALLAVIN